MSGFESRNHQRPLQGPLCRIEHDGRDADREILIYEAAWFFGWDFGGGRYIFFSRSSVSKHYESDEVAVDGKRFSYKS